MVVIDEKTKLKDFMAAMQTFEMNLAVKQVVLECVLLVKYCYRVINVLCVVRKYKLFFELFYFDWYFAEIHVDWRN